MSEDVWELPATCGCWHCKGGKNKHAWSFYYFLKRAGDRPRVSVANGIIRIVRGALSR